MVKKRKRRKRKPKKEFVYIAPKKESVEKLKKIYNLRVIMSLLILVAGLLVSFVPAIVPSLNGFVTVGVMLGMPAMILGIVAFSMYKMMLKRLELSS